MFNLLNRVSLLGVLVFFSLALSLSFAKADRLKDMTSIAGVRSNQLVGYGLVVGLAGSGDGNAVLTQQAIQERLTASNKRSLP